MFYLDPPYWGSESDYGKTLFSRQDFPLMVACLKHLKGRFILSLNDAPEVRDLFSDFPMLPVTTSYSVGGGAKTTKAGELIIASSSGMLGQEGV